MDTLLEKELTGRILNVFYYVYNELGFGFKELTYQKAMRSVFLERGIPNALEFELPVFFHGQKIDTYRADLIVDCKVIVELKAVRALNSAHEAQLLNYLRATDIEVGMLLNFGEKPTFKRLAFENEKKLRINAMLFQFGKQD